MSGSQRPAPAATVVRIPEDAIVVDADTDNNNEVRFKTESFS